MIDLGPGYRSSGRGAEYVFLHAGIAHVPQVRVRETARTLGVCNLPVHVAQTHERSTPAWFS